MEFVSYHHLIPILLLPVSTVSARVDGSNASSPKFKFAISDWIHDTDLLPGKLLQGNFYYRISFQIQKPRGHIVIILIELARGMHLLFSIYAFSHIVPFYHLPSGSGCLISHCLDKARDA